MLMTTFSNTIKRDQTWSNMIRHDKTCIKHDQILKFHHNFIICVTSDSNCTISTTSAPVQQNLNHFDFGTARHNMNCLDPKLWILFICLLNFILGLLLHDSLLICGGIIFLLVLYQWQREEPREWDWKTVFRLGKIKLMKAGVISQHNMTDFKIYMNLFI